MFGKDALPLDKFFKSMQLGSVVDKEVSNLKPEHKIMLQAYADGVNAYASEHATILPIEFKILNIGFDKWTIRDTMGIFKFSSFMMSSGWQLSPLRTGIAQRYGKEVAEMLIPYKTFNTFFEETVIVDSGLDKIKKEPLVLPPKLDEVKTDIHKSTEEKKYVDPTRKISKASVPKGSNTWVIHGNHTTSGKPMLANDPHLSHHSPSEFCLVSLKFPDGQTMFGTSIPGVPILALGRSQYMAWGVTMSLLENIDLWDIKLNDQKTHYFYNNTWVPLKITKEKIKVRGEEPYEYTALRTHHGPILDYPLIPEVGTLFAYFYKFC